VPINAKNSTNMKVVHLEPESQRLARARIARLPAAIHAVHERGKQLLLERLKVFFDQADDSLFGLADKASSNEEQNLFFDSMREVRVQRRGIERRFSAAVDAAFACLATGEIQERSAIYDDSISSDALSLVQNDELEEVVATESSVSRANDEYGEWIQQISLRLDSLVPVKVFQKNNPLGPAVLAPAFMDQVKRLDIDIKAKLVLFKLFDKAVMQNLGKLYTAINDLLIDHNVLPTLTRATSPRGVSSPSQASVADPSPASLQQNPVNEQVATLLQGLLAEQQKTASVPAGVPSDVIRLLSLAQNTPTLLGDYQGGIKAMDLISELQERSGSQAQIGRTEQEVINVVDMLFKFILDDRNLADPMKEQISRLQIPIVKVALLDKSFFAKGGHAARRLLNEMATAALGWQPAKDNSRDPLYSKINELVSTLLRTFDTDVRLFNELLADFSSFIDKDRRRAQVLERRTLDAEDGKARAEVSRTIVSIEVELRTVDQDLPEVVEKLVKGPWSNVLFINNLKHGSESQQWSDALQTLEDLIWTTQVPRNAEDRKRLIRMVPDLLQRLRVGLDTISFNPFEMSEIFKQLEDVHLTCIRGNAKRSAEPSASRMEPAESEEVQGLAASEPEPVTEREPEPAEPEFELPETDVAEDIFDDIDAVLGIAEKPEKPTEDKQGSDVESPEAEVVEAQSPSRETGISAENETSDPPVTSTENGHEPAADKIAISDDTDPFMQQVAGFVQGSWFEITDDDGVVNRCRLAAHIKPTGKYIFVNRNGMKVAERQQEDLALLLRQNRLRALDNSMLFDRALETVVTSLRKHP